MCCRIAWKEWSSRLFGNTKRIWPPVLWWLSIRARVAFASYLFDNFLRLRFSLRFFLGAPMIRNRIKRHIRVRASDLVPHELNPRLHSDTQRQALADLYRDIGFARSLLAYELPDGRLKL